MYAIAEDRDSCIKALTDLQAFIDEEGPFDAVMAFSQGAGLAASLIIHRIRQEQAQQRTSSSSPPLFRCAIFFCGGVPEDPTAAIEGKERRLLSFEEDGELIDIPTAHIWGRHDKLYPTFGPVLSKLCKASEREDFVHEGGHEIPGPRDPAAVAKTVQVIKRTLTRASLL